MSLVIDLAVLAEGVASDSRGNLTLVAANPHLFVADELPFQFAPVFVASVTDEDGADPGILTPGVTVNVKVQVEGPADETLFVAQLRQIVQPSPFPNLRPRLQMVAQVPFTASKAGIYRISADFEVLGSGSDVLGTVTAARTLRVSDAAALKAKRN